MLKAVSIALCLIAATCSAQTEMLDGILPMKDGRVTYTGVDTVEGATKHQLYQRARRWFVDTYRSKNAVVQIDDDERGELVGKGFFIVIWNYIMTSTTVDVYHTVTVEMKDGRYRYTFSDFYFRYDTGGPGTGLPLSESRPMIEDFAPNMAKQRAKLYHQVSDQMTTLLRSMRDAMNKPVADDW